MGTEGPSLDEIRARQDWIAGQIDQVRELRMMTSQGGTNLSNIRISADSAGVWVCAICAAVCVVAVVFMKLDAVNTAVNTAADIRELRAKQARTDDYLNAIYRQYPELRPKEAKK